MSPEPQTEYSTSPIHAQAQQPTSPSRQKRPKRKSVHFESREAMSRMPPAAYYASRDALPWDDHNNSYYNYLDPHEQYLDPSDRDEYDDFAYERSRGHPNLPQPQVSLSHTGSLRTSYRNPQSAASSIYETREITSPTRQYGNDYDAHYERYGGYDHGQSPTRSYHDYQRDNSPMRSGSPTRMPLTAAGTGYEMEERKPGEYNQMPTAAWQQEEKKTLTKRKWIIIGIVLFILAAAATGVTIWLVKFRNSGSSSTGSANGRNGYGATSKDLKMDSKLKKIFDGMDYTPLDAQYPGCGCTQANITADVAILSQLTNKIRLYGTDCDQATMVLNAIQDLKVDLTVFLGVWVDNNSTTVERQLSAMYDILNKYPVDLIDGIAVGNEVLFRKDLTETQLITMIKEVKTNVTAMNLGKTLPICTSDLGSNWTPAMSAAVDCVMANIHPFFSGIDVNQASEWTLEFLTNNVISTLTGLSPQPSIIISEVGWPSGGGSINGSVASIDNMQYFLDHFPSTAKNANVTYYWFEGYDEPWKVIYNTPTASYEDKWGLLDVNGYLKDGITLPSSV